MYISSKYWMMMYADMTVNERKTPITLRNEELIPAELGESLTEMEARQIQMERKHS